MRNKIEISMLRDNERENYASMLDRCDEATFFHTIEYRNLLEDFLSVDSYYIIAKKNEEVVGAIPAFIKEERQYGNVINSSPFFGSHGGFLTRSDLDQAERREIKVSLLKEYERLGKEKNCILSTIVTSPFDDDIAFYEENLIFRYKDQRIACIKEFPSHGGDIEEALMGSLTSRCRRAIRRALKNDIAVGYSEDFEPLFEMHKTSISAKGGLVKPLDFFRLVSKSMKGHYGLVYARKDDVIIAGLLTFRFKYMVEYFTPALSLEHVVEQGGSLLIFKEMKRAMADGYRYWNFGGSGKEQNGLYMFKKSWGSNDRPYYYYVTQWGNVDGIMELEPQQIMEKYKWFYVIPFGQFEKSS